MFFVFVGVLISVNSHSFKRHFVLFLHEKICTHQNKIISDEKANLRQCTPKYAHPRTKKLD